MRNDVAHPFDAAPLNLWMVGEPRSSRAHVDTYPVRTYHVYCEYHAVCSR